VLSAGEHLLPREAATEALEGVGQEVEGKTSLGQDGKILEYEEPHGAELLGLVRLLDGEHKHEAPGQKPSPQKAEGARQSGTCASRICWEQEGV